MMGGYGSGGHNRTHRAVEDFRHGRIDSFAMAAYLAWDKYLHLKDHVHYPLRNGPITYYPKTKIAHIDENGTDVTLGLSRVPGVDRYSVKLYFICPACGRRIRYLYKRNGLYICRRCAGLNYKIQQRSGRQKLVLQMEHIVEKRLGYLEWHYDHPDITLPDLYIIPKPLYMRNEKYNALMEKFRKLQNEYNDSLLQEALAVLKRTNMWWQ